MEEIGNSWTNYRVGTSPYVVGAATIIGAYYTWRMYRASQKAKPAPRKVQSMMDSVDGTQTATGEDVLQEMKNSRGGKQDA